MSQTMATKHLRAVEDRLGVKLFHRTTRRVALTEAGRGYLESVQRILAEVDDADALASAERFQVRGTLRLNVPLSFGMREMAPRLAEFAARHPLVKVGLGLNDRFVDLVDEGWDLAVRIGTLDDSSLIARKLAPCRVVVCAAPSYLARRGTPRTLANLKHHNCLGYTLSRMADADHRLFGERGTVRVPVAGDLRANNGDALVAAALAGQGVVFQPTFLVGPELRAGRLVALNLDLPLTQPSGVFAVYPSGRQPPAKVRAMIDFLAERFTAGPPWDRDLP